MNWKKKNDYYNDYYMIIRTSTLSEIMKRFSGPGPQVRLPSKAQTVKSGYLTKQGGLIKNWYSFLFFIFLSFSSCSFFNLFVFGLFLLSLFYYWCLVRKRRWFIMGNGNLYYTPDHEVSEMLLILLFFYINYTNNHYFLKKWRILKY